ncbi:MAG: rod shape-determining protein MreC [Nitrococcus sp.]|nr:rod shape-determining protein MreC [Nitrococcus sp.]
MTISPPGCSVNGNKRWGQAIKPLFRQGPSLTARVILLALLSIVLMSLGGHRQGTLESVRYTLSAVVYPIRVVAELPFELGDLISRRLSGRQQLLAKNERLRAQRLLNEARLQKLDALEQENIRLRELLGSSQEVDEPVLIAELMRVDLDPYSHLVQISKGARDGVFRGQPVLDANGVIGQVDKVGPFSAVVRLITDPSHAIPVRVNRNGVRAVAVGTGHLHELKLINLPNNTDIRPGDLLITSGLGGRFPPGYPVARVASVTTDPGPAFARVEARPTAALDRLQEVLLVKRDQRPARLADPGSGTDPRPGKHGEAKQPGS